MSEGLTLIEGGASLNATPEKEKADLARGSKNWASKTRRRAKELVQELDLGYMELARILYQVFDTPIDGDRQRGAIYTSWGFTSFGDYAERELGIHHKKAERLRLIWFTLEVQLEGLDAALKERVVALGYSKVRELVRVLTLRNATTWIEQAENMTYRQLYAEVVDEKRRQGVEDALLGAGSDGEPADPAQEGEPLLLDRVPTPVVEKLYPQRFDLFPLQLENVTLALKKAGELCGSDKRGHQLDMICTDFLSGNDFMGGDSDKRLRYVAKLEKQLGLKLIVVDPDAKEIVYGIDALQLVADS